MNRNAEIAKIHIAKKALGMCNETYREGLFTLTGKSSCAQIPTHQLGKVIDWLKKCGWQAQKSNPMPKQRKKIYYYWEQLHKIGAIKLNSKLACDNWMCRQLDIHSDVRALNNLHAEEFSSPLESIKRWVKREEQKRAN